MRISTNEVQLNYLSAKFEHIYVHMYKFRACILYMPALIIDKLH